MIAAYNSRAGAGGDEASGCPLVAYEALVFRRTLCAMTLYYLESPEQLSAGGHSQLDLVLTPEMARRLANALAKIAERAQQETALH
jgi:hypothetical protein